MLLPVLEGPTKFPVEPPAPPMLDAVPDVPPEPVLPPVPAEDVLEVPFEPHAPSVTPLARATASKKSQLRYEKRRSILGD